MPMRVPRKSTPVPTPGARERAKAERRERLKDAALSMFLQKGYEATTTREIAERAGVGPATLFRYAVEKRDLLLMILNDDLTAIDRQAFADLDIDAPMVEALLVLFGPRYYYFAKHPALSREATHLTVLARADKDTFETQRYRHRRGQLLATMTKLVRHGQERGILRGDYQPPFLAAFFLDIYLAHRRHWLTASKPSPARGIEALRAMLHLAIDGVRSQGASSSHRRRKKS